MRELDQEQQLVLRAGEGDKHAFDALMLRYQKKVAQLLSRYLREPSDVSDATQEVFIKALRALPSFRGDCTFYTWIYRIAVNTAKNHIQAEQRKRVDIQQDISELEWYLDVKQENNPEGVLIGEEVVDGIFHAIQVLPKDLRVAITLRELQGLSYEQIAHIQKCPIGTVRSRIFRGRALIFKRIKPLLKH